MPYKPDISTSELRRLYEVDGLTLRQIADRVGVTYQAVHLRLVNAGVELRKRGTEASHLERDTLERLYVGENLSIKEVAAQLGLGEMVVISALERYGIEKRAKGRPRKYTEIVSLEVGQEIIIPNPTVKYPHQTIRQAIVELGFQAKVKTVDKAFFRIKRTG